MVVPFSLSWILLLVELDVGVSTEGDATVARQDQPVQRDRGLCGSATALDRHSRALNAAVGRSAASHAELGHAGRKADCGIGGKLGQGALQQGGGNTGVGRVVRSDVQHGGRVGDVPVLVVQPEKKKKAWRLIDNSSVCIN